MDILTTTTTIATTSIAATTAATIFVSIVDIADDVSIVDS